MVDLQALLSMLPPGTLDKMTPRNKAIELLWLHSLVHLGNTNNEVIIPKSVTDKWGDALVGDLAQRLEAHLGRPVHSTLDHTISCFRIWDKNAYPMYPLPFRDQGILDDIRKAVGDAIEDGLQVPLASPRVPRPANKFICYRQHYHQQVAALNPGIKNTEISRIIAQMWAKETPAVRAQFTRIANEKRRLHSVAHPNYQYSPRRSREIRRRVPRVRTRQVPFFKHSAAGRAKVKDADENNDGWVDVDAEFIGVLDDLGLMYGPNSLGPLPDPASANSQVALGTVGQQLAHQQLGQQVSVQTINYTEPNGEEFDPDFPMAALLALP